MLCVSCALDNKHTYARIYAPMCILYISHIVYAIVQHTHKTASLHVRRLTVLNLHRHTNFINALVCPTHNIIHVRAQPHRTTHTHTHAQRRRWNLVYVVHLPSVALHLPRPPLDSTAPQQYALRIRWRCSPQFVCVCVPAPPGSQPPRTCLYSICHPSSVEVLRAACFCVHVLVNMPVWQCHRRRHRGSFWRNENYPSRSN